MRNTNIEVYCSEVPGGLGLIVMHSFNTGTLKAGVYAKVFSLEKADGQYLSFEAENTLENREILFDTARSWVNIYLFKNIGDCNGAVLETNAFPRGYTESEDLKVVNSKRLVHLCVHHENLVNLVINTTKSTRFRDLLKHLDDYSKKIKVETLS